MKVAHSYTLQIPGTIRLITLFYIGSVNYNQIYQTGVYVIENLSLDNFRQVDLHYAHLRSVPVLFGTKPAVWFGVSEIFLGA